MYSSDDSGIECVLHHRDERIHDEKINLMDCIYPINRMFQIISHNMVYDVSRNIIIKDNITINEYKKPVPHKSLIPINVHNNKEIINLIDLVWPDIDAPEYKYILQINAYSTPKYITLDLVANPSALVQTARGLRQRLQGLRQNKYLCANFYSATYFYVLLSTLLTLQYEYFDGDTIDMDYSIEIKHNFRNLKLHNSKNGKKNFNYKIISKKNNTKD